jgi:putative DNA primase/helicase
MGGVVTTAPSTQPDLIRFLDALFPDPAGHWILFWGLPSKRSEWTQSITPDLSAKLEQRATTEDVYIGCGLRGDNLGPHIRGDKADVVGITGLWLDVDFGSEHTKRNLPPNEDTAMELVNLMGLRPSAVIHSGHGLQVWWLFREPWMFENDEDRAKADALAMAWSSTLRARAKTLGFDADQVGDITRVMRLPDLWNRKGVPVKTRLLSLTDDRYDPDDFEPFLLAVPGRLTAAPTVQCDFNFDPNAEPPAEKFRLLCEVDRDFLRSWMHDREEFQDQSASAYDLSLATRAFAADWTPQEVVNLLIACRRKHKADLKLRRDYYKRTLKKALEGKDGDENSAGGSMMSVPTPEAVGQSTDENGSTSGPRRFPCTDSGNAESFADRYRDEVRYDHRRGLWLLWKGHRWAPDMDATINQLAKDSVRHRFTTASSGENGKKRKKLANWAIQSESRPKLDALLKLAQSEPAIADVGDSWDSDPFLFGVPNGVIDLHTGRLRDGRREDRVTKNAAVPFDPSATCPQWEQFILDLFGGDSDLAAFLHRAVGYSVSGDTTEQCLFLCYGPGSNGKSTFISTIHALLGDYAANMPFTAIEYHQRASIPNDIAALVGQRFVSSSETNDGTRLNEARIKTLTGCDPITARFLQQEFFTFNPVAKLWLCVNHEPVIRDDSHGFWRRIRAIPLLQTFTPNRTFSAGLRCELAGILAWAVRGCLEWQRVGLNPPLQVINATAAYRRDNDVLGDFLESACRLCDDEDDHVPAHALYQHYHEWAQSQGYSHQELLSSTMFGRKVGRRFKSFRNSKGKFYKGIRCVYSSKSALLSKSVTG